MKIYRFKPVLSGQPVLSGHFVWLQACPDIIGFTISYKECLTWIPQYHWFLTIYTFYYLVHRLIIRLYIYLFFHFGNIHSIYFAAHNLYYTFIELLLSGNAKNCRSTTVRVTLPLFHHCASHVGKKVRYFHSNFWNI